MSSKKSFIFQMLMIIGLFFSVSNYNVVEVSADMVSDLCFENSDKEKCSEPINNADEEQSKSASSNIGVFDYIKVLLALGAVLAVLVYILKYVNRKTSSYQKNSMMKNLGGLSLGTQKSAQLIQIGNRLYIVGVGEDITLLKEIDDEEEIKQLLQFYDAKQEEFSSTSPFIKQVFDKYKNKNKKSNTTSTSFNNVLNAKLGDLKKERSQELEMWKEKENDKHE